MRLNNNCEVRVRMKKTGDKMKCRVSLLQEECGADGNPVMRTVAKREFVGTDAQRCRQDAVSLAANCLYKPESMRRFINDR